MYKYIKKFFVYDPIENKEIEEGHILMQKIFGPSKKELEKKIEKKIEELNIDFKYKKNKKSYEELKKINSILIELENILKNK